MKLKSFSFLCTALVVLGVMTFARGQTPQRLPFNGTFYSGTTATPHQYDVSPAADESVLLDIYNDDLRLYFIYHFANTNIGANTDRVSFWMDNTGAGVWETSILRWSQVVSGYWFSEITRYSGDCNNLQIVFEDQTSGHMTGYASHQNHLDVVTFFYIDPNVWYHITIPKRVGLGWNIGSLVWRYPQSSLFCDPSTWPNFVLASKGVGPVVYFSHHLYELGSEARGDGDGRPESGERLELAVKLINMGDQNAQLTTATLQVLPTPYVTIVDSSNYWEDIAGGEAKDNLGGFVFDIDPNLSFNTAVTFKLNVAAVGGLWTSTFQVPIYVQDQVQISAPTDLVPVAPTATTLPMAWVDNNNNEDGFVIERMVGNSGNWTELVRVGANVTSYTDTGLSGGQTYSYRVRAFRGSIYSDYSNVISYTPNPPTAFFTDIAAPLKAGFGDPAVWGDYDNDGDLDLLIIGGVDSSYVYRNDGGNFVDVKAGLKGGATGSAEWGDYDNDGDLDILLTGASGGSAAARVYRNDGSHFVDIAAPLGFFAKSVGTWGDYDNDGDLDILLTGGGSITRIFRNEAGTFININAPLHDTDYSAAAWGDYDNDGDLDIFLAGKLGPPVPTPSPAQPTKIYRNDAGVFVDIAAPLRPCFKPDMAWGDHDHDGDLDIVLTGQDEILDFPFNKVYRNDGGSFVDIAAALIAVREGTVDWGDCDNDGDLDILLTGETPAGPITRIFINENGNFVNLDAGLIGVYRGSANWGDYDNDGDLDIVLTGYTGSSYIAKIYRNNFVTPNSPPQAPAGLTAGINGNAATLSWGKATDNETPQNGLTYNLRVGKTPGDSEVMSPMSEANSGYRRVPQLGNVNHNTSWTLKNLPPGKYYWSVQAIDNAFAGSAFAPEQSFVINATALKPEVQAEQAAGAEFWVDVAVSNVQNLFGLSLELNYTNTQFVDVVTPASSSVIPGAFLGNDVVFVSNVDETAGKVNIGISRKAGQDGISGSGVIARVRFKAAVLTPSGTQVIFSFSNVSANEPSGNVINVQLASVTVTFKLDGLIVWPGDANNDKLVNQADVLPIGLHWNKTGPAREGATIGWSAQLATPWTPAAATYADGNGDGTVNQADVLPIGLNWGKTHSASSLLAGDTDGAIGMSKVKAATLSMAIVGDTNPGQEFWIDIQVAEVTDLFGISFELLYSPSTFVEAQTAEAGNLLGNDVIFFPNLDKAIGKVSIGLTRKSGQGGVTGAGVVVSIKMKMSSSAALGAKTELTLLNVTANDPAGQAIQLSVIGQSLITKVESTTAEQLPTAFALYGNVPNPFNPSTTIKYDLAAPSEVTVVIFDMLGKPVRTLVSARQPAGRYAVQWDGRDSRGLLVASGVFICQLRIADPVKGGADGFVQSRKMLLLQ